MLKWVVRPGKTMASVGRFSGGAEWMPHHAWTTIADTLVWICVTSAFTWIEPGHDGWIRRCMFEKRGAGLRSPGDEVVSHTAMRMLLLCMGSMALVALMKSMRAFLSLLSVL
jgi:hypothetical protein